MSARHAREVVQVPPPESAEAGSPRWLTSAEVAVLFGVDPKTVTRWAVAGRLPSSTTAAGRHRFPTTEVHALLAQLTTDPH